MKTHRLVLAAALVLTFASGPSAVAADDSPEVPSFTFMQFSDIHVGATANRPVHTRLVAAIELANSLKPAFVIASGDLTDHPVYEASKSHLAELGEYKKCMAGLTVPLYDLPGNHDIGYFDPSKSQRSKGRSWGDYDKLTAEYRRQIGPLDQTFTSHGVGFLLINDNPPASGQPPHVSAKQLRWIEDHLNRYDRAFLFCHVQLLARTDGQMSPWGEAAAQLVAICKRYRVAAVAFGHEHNAYVKTIDGTHYIMCPDLKMPDHQAVYQYRVFPDRFELWRYDVFSREGSKVGSYPTLERPAPEHNQKVPPNRAAEVWPGKLPSTSAGAARASGGQLSYCDPLPATTP